MILLMNLHLMLARLGIYKSFPGLKELHCHCLPSSREQIWVKQYNQLRVCCTAHQNYLPRRPADHLFGKNLELSTIWCKIKPGSGHSPSQIELRSSLQSQNQCPRTEVLHRGTFAGKARAQKEPQQQCLKRGCFLLKLSSWMFKT